MTLSWELLYGLGALALFAALLYGVIQYKRRNRANDPLTEEATRQEYNHPEGYSDRQDALKARVRRS